MISSPRHCHESWTPLISRSLLVLLIWHDHHQHPAQADEGMWLFNDPPRELLKAKYDFDATDAWLDHLQQSAVRFNSGGSGSFVSADGLVMTNHHVGADALQKLQHGRARLRQRRLSRQDPGRGNASASTWN